MPAVLDCFLQTFTPKPLSFDIIVSLNKQAGITVVLCEQFARPVFPVIDRGYIVENGMLTLMGTGEELMQNPEIKAAYFGI